MDLSSFVTPEPAARHDGWNPERKLRFLDRLAASGNVRSACSRAGMSRDAAYRLRRRDPQFARGWAAALVLARESSNEVLADRAIDGTEEEVWYRGELVGTRRRFDGRLLLAHLARLDRMIEEAAGTAVEDAARFDEILACLAGAQVPEDLPAAADGLPLPREAVAAEAESEMRGVMEEAFADLEADRERGAITDEEYAEDEAEYLGEPARARAEAYVQWDAWYAGACAAVDDAVDFGRAPPVPGLPGNPLPPLSAEAAAPETGQAFSCPRTVSNVSVSALARALAGPATGFVSTPRSPFQAPRRGRR